MLTNNQHKELTLLLQRIVHEAMEAANVVPQPTCITCKYFDHKDETCFLAGKRPPARVIAEGCPAYIADGIPF